MCFTQKGSKGEGSTIVHHRSDMYFWFDESNVGTRQTSDDQENTKGCASAFYVFLPSQNAIGDMHTSRTIGIGLHKQWVIISTCMYRSYLREHVFNNEQVGCQPTQLNSRVYVIQSREIICSRTCRNMYSRNTSILYRYTGSTNSC